MLFTVMYQMAAPAKRLEVFRLIISRIVPMNALINQRKRTQNPAALIAPFPRFLIPPPPVAQTLNLAAILFYGVITPS